MNELRHAFAIAAASVLALAALPSTAHAAEPECELEGPELDVPAGHLPVVVTLARQPPARAVVSLAGDNGASYPLVFDPATDDPLRRTVTVPAGHYRVTYSGAALNLPGADKQPPRRLEQRACWTDRSRVAGKATVALVELGDDDPKPPPLLTVTVSLGGPTCQEPVKAAVDCLAKAPACDGGNCSKRDTARAACAAVPATCDPLVGAADERLPATADLGVGGDARAFGLDTAIPAAVTEVLQLLAEIALDKAKAEALRAFKKEVVSRVCEDLTPQVFGGAGTAPLLPATCGQLENLRLADLGGSAPGLLAALRQDLAAVVVPQLVARLHVDADPATARFLALVASRAAADGLSLDEVRLALVGLAADQATAAVTALPGDAVIRHALLRAVVAVAARCTSQPCSAADVLDALRAQIAPGGDLAGAARRLLAEHLLDLAERALLVDSTAKALTPEIRAAAAKAWAAARSTLIDAVAAVDATAPDQLAGALADALAATLTGEAATAVKAAGADKALTSAVQRWIAANTSLTAGAAARVTALVGALPDLAAAVARARAILAGPAAASPRAQAAEVVALVLDLVVATRCHGSDTDGDQRCRTEVGAVRDTVLGALDGDYLRALGGVATGLRLAGTALAPRKALELVGSIMSYLDTYRATKDLPEDQQRARRKQALEALIAAATDRSGRRGDTIISLSTSVGFVGGYRNLVHSRRADGTGDVATDLVLPIGFSVVKTFARGWTRWACIPRPNYAHFSVGDLGRFVSPPGSSSEQVRQWSDFVALGFQGGWAVGLQVPFVFGVEVSFAPQLRYQYDVEVDGTATTPAQHYTTATEGMFRAGVFVGFNVPLFDLN